MGLFMIGNLFRECKVVERLLKTSQNELLNIVTIILGIAVGSTMKADIFLKPQPIFIFILGLVAFAFSTAGGDTPRQIHEPLLKREDQPSYRLCRCISCAYGREGNSKGWTGG